MKVKDSGMDFEMLKNFELVAEKDAYVRKLGNRFRYIGMEGRYVVVQDLDNFEEGHIDTYDLENLIINRMVNFDDMKTEQKIKIERNIEKLKNDIVEINEEIRELEYTLREKLEEK